MENARIKGRDIIMLGIQPWDLDIAHNFKNMAHVISEDNRVLYVNRPLDRITMHKSPEDVKTKNRLKSIREGSNTLETVNENLWIFNPPVILESINWMPHNFVYHFFNKRNNRLLARAIKNAAAQIGFKDAVMFIDNDFYNGLYLPEYVNAPLNLYYLRDFLLAQPYFNKHGKFAEPAIIKKVDAVVTNSLYLTSYAAQYNSNSYYTGQGCGEEFFVPRPEVFPEDVTHIPHPIIGYCGFLTGMRLDIELMEYIAQTKPEWNMVLIGPEDDAFKNSALHQMKNVYFLGNKDVKELPAYVHYFDVCLNPQEVNQLTIGNYPRKVDEYLAVGKPVVATRTETMEDFADCTYLCNGKDAYIQAIERAFKEKDDIRLIEHRIAVAKSHSWENSVRRVYEAIELTERQKKQ
jgi:glycosyltransferase involved in cell wall biosynthesis